ncbi:MAG: hypothetical protein RH948_10865 [Cyclobacteriaceae bacterium]
MKILSIKNIVAVLIVFFSTNVLAQVGFNNPNPHASSVLDLTANDKGLLIPRMTTIQREALSATAAVGLLVFDTQLNGFFFFNAGQWYALNEFVKTAAVSNEVSANGVRITNLANAINSGDAVNKAQIDSKVDRSGDSMSGTLEVLGGIRTQNAGDYLKTKVIEIGDWNMLSTFSVIVPLGVSRLSIRSIDITIRSDGSGEYSLFPLAIGSGLLGGWYQVNNAFSPSDVIILYRTNSGFFSQVNFSSTGYNRGWITITYM